MDRSFQAVVIGAGSGGLTAARRLALAGKRTALVEADRLGGDCLNWGCVPTKTLVSTAKLRHQIAHAGDVGLQVGPAQLDFAAVMTRVAAVQAEVGAEERRYYLEEPGVEVIHGTARFVDPHMVAIGEDEQVSFEQCVIATGSRPQIPPIPGLAEADYLTNVTALQLDHLPASFVIIGGGPIGCEFAQLFRRLGSQVAVLQRAGRLLPREEPEASETVARVFAREGIDVRLGVEVRRVEQRGDRRAVTAVAKDGEFSLEAAAVLVAAGRLPNVEALHLGAAGVATDRRGIITDPHMRTSTPHIWAIGDVAGKYQFTHVAGEQGWIAAGQALGKRGTFHDQAVPWCTFTDPQVARVGRTEEEARRRYGSSVTALVWPFRQVDRAVTMGEQEGFIKIITRPGLLRGLGGGEVVGAQIVGPEAGELIGQLTMLMANRLPLGLFARTIQPYPTLSLGVRQAASQPWESAADIRSRHDG